QNCSGRHSGAPRCGDGRSPQRPRGACCGVGHNTRILSRPKSEACLDEIRSGGACPPDRTSADTGRTSGRHAHSAAMRLVRRLSDARAAPAATFHQMIAGIDLGGTQVRVAVARSDGRIIATTRNWTEALRTPRRVVEWATDQTLRLSDGGPLDGVGVGAPGPTDPVRGVLVNPPNLAGWKNVPLAAMLRELIDCPVYLENDANLAGLGEFHQGAGRGTRTMVYVTWSTGVGAGLILDGRLFSGAHGAGADTGDM